MNIRTRIILIVSVAVGFLAVAGVYVYSNVMREAPVVVDQSAAVSMETSSETTEATPFVETLYGEDIFTGVDTIHWASGGVEARSTEAGPVLTFKSDFAVADGPDLFVYLSPNEAGEGLGEYASLGQLKATSGEQTYVLPENFASYKTVVIWCRAFGVTFATASPF